MSQKEQILEHLKTGRSITAIEALEYFGCMRLAARIDEIRETHKVKMETVRNGKKSYARYWLEVV